MNRIEEEAQLKQEFDGLEKEFNRLVLRHTQLLRASKQALTFLNQLGYNSSGNTPEANLRAAISVAESEGAQ